MIKLTCFSADPTNNQDGQKIEFFSSYVFDRSVLTPASAFRFTAPGVDKTKRLAIRSGDTVRLSVQNDLGQTFQVGVGFIDDTNTHVTARNLDYVITGRDTVGQLVDNDTLDVQNKIIFYKQINLNGLVSQLLKGTRAIGSFRTLQIDPKRTFAISTQPNETKLNCLQRTLEWCNGLVWADTDGSLIVDKPNFSQAAMGLLIMDEDDKITNVLEASVKRNVNQAIRQIVTVLNTTEASSATVQAETLQNMDNDLKKYRNTNVGRSVSRTFDYAHGTDTINQGQGVGQGSYAPHTLGKEYSAREIARENMNILDVELVVEGHFNGDGLLYNVDQVYDVNISDEDVNEPMYVYHVSYELTLDHGMMTRMRLCRLWTICAYADQLGRVVAK